MTETEQRAAAKKFAEYWADKGYEKGESQKFWIDLLEHVFGVEDVSDYIRFEDKVVLDHASFIDGFIPSVHVLIEQKALGTDLEKGAKQSDGKILSPFQQAKRYAAELPYSQRPRWIVVCNFEQFQIYDMENPRGEPERILLKDLPRDYWRLNFLVDAEDDNLKRETAVSVAAGDIVGKIYDALLKQYRNPDDKETLKSLNVLCVRLVFCLFAEDAGIFGKHSIFYDYLNQFDALHTRQALIELFKVLDTKTENRDPYLSPDLAAFPYVNGGLFADENIEIPQFTDEIRTLILVNASKNFDWSEISPTIFGAVFESTLNPETRRTGGMHYTSVENIHKIIDPLFLDDLKEEFNALKSKKDLLAFQTKLSALTFLDPACGSGNFLTETYLSLRKLENGILRKLSNGQKELDVYRELIQVSIGQFYGIEINDFAVTVAKTALWIAESQMMRQTEDIVQKDLDFLPLKSYSNIIEANALRVDWETVVAKNELTYIISNPPFVGASLMTSEQKEDAVKIFGKIKLSNSIDYVGAWYYKAAALMQNTKIKAALVSTNSIIQGEQVAPLWKTLLEKYNVKINFAYRTFRWDSEANIKAHVHCVIIGFSCFQDKSDKIIFDKNGREKAKNINPYLIDADDILIESRSKTICDVPKMTKGNQPTGKDLILSEQEKDELIKKDTSVSCCVRRYVGGEDFLNNNEVRYCLWLKNVSPSVYRGNKEILRRINEVRLFREKSTSPTTRKSAEKAYQFFSTPQTESEYLILPRVSSERRKYIPIGFMPPDVIAADSCSIIPDATLYHFGVLTSSVHMAWMRTVCGRLKSDYRYSGSVVYNNFPWCEPTEKQRADIEKTARAILDARAKYPDCSLADLYDELSMPADLRKAHQDNDRAVMKAYGFRSTMRESDCVAALFSLYKQKTD